MKRQQEAPRAPSLYHKRLAPLPLRAVQLLRRRVPGPAFTAPSTPVSRFATINTGERRSFKRKTPQITPSFFSGKKKKKALERCQIISIKNKENNQRVSKCIQLSCVNVSERLIILQSFNIFSLLTFRSLENCTFFFFCTEMNFEETCSG